MISKSGIHAVTAVVALAKLDGESYLGASDIAEKTGAPPNYLGKLLKTLAEEGILESQKGKNGGFRLARPAETVSMYDVVEPIDRVSRWQGCFLGRNPCCAESPCPVHQRWAKVRDCYLDFLKHTMIAEIAEADSRFEAKN